VERPSVGLVETSTDLMNLKFIDYLRTVTLLTIDSKKNRAAERSSCLGGGRAAAASVSQRVTRIFR